MATQANENNLLGVPLTLCGLDPVAHRFGVIEAGISERGEMAELAKMIEPDVAVITVVARRRIWKNSVPSKASRMKRRGWRRRCAPAAGW